VAEPKKPQDRKPKNGTVIVRGIALNITPDALDDFELLDDMAAVQNKDGSRLPSVFRRLVGDQYQEVLDALRGENGRVSIETAVSFIQETLEAVNPNG